MGSFKQNPKNKLWEVTISLGYDENGKRKRIKKCGFKTKKAAIEYEIEVKNSIKNGTFICKEVHLKDFIKEYIDFKIKSNKSESTIYNNNNYLNNILAITGNIRLSDINNRIMQDTYFKLLEKGYKPSSAKNIMTSLTSLLKYAYKLELIHKIPTYELIQDKDKKDNSNYWSLNELKFFLNEIKDTGLFLLVPISIAAYTGMRVAEICALKWKDIDLKEGYISVSHQIIQDKNTNTLIDSDKLKTSNSKRIISIPEILIELLKEYESNKNNYVLSNDPNKMIAPGTLSLRFTDKIKMINRHENKLRYITFHGLRHTHATLLIMNNENIKVVSERLGHANINITLDTYTKVLKENKKNTAVLLDTIFKDQ